jgi:hypothetical protein
MVTLGIGDLDRTFELFENAYRERSGYLVYFNIDPQLDELRADPRLIELLKKIGF